MNQSTMTYPYKVGDIVRAMSPISLKMTLFGI